MDRFAILEEAYHFMQRRRDVGAPIGPDHQIARREVEAKEWLLGQTEVYGIPGEEVESTRLNLAY